MPTEPDPFDDLVLDDEFVANDIHVAPASMSEPAHKPIWLVTGANYSGKSVMLKQTALITYMAHIGSYVPAERAVIGVTDGMYSRIQTRESISKACSVKYYIHIFFTISFSTLVQDQSAFGIDLMQALTATRHVTKRSLVILDEFGKGTATAGISYTFIFIFTDSSY